MVYVDASFMVTFLCKEPSTPLAVRWVEAHPEAALVSADWCMTEVASALSLKLRTRQIGEAQCNDAWKHFERACDGLLSLEPVQPEDFASAAVLCRMTSSGLGAGDSLHLAVARRLGCSQMLSFDKTLNFNAQACSLEILNP